MKTKAKKLQLKTQSLVELNANDLRMINGGTTTTAATHILTLTPLLTPPPTPVMSCNPPIDWKETN